MDRTHELEQAIFKFMSTQLFVPSVEFTLLVPHIHILTVVARTSVLPLTLVIMIYGAPRLNVTEKLHEQP